MTDYKRIYSRKQRRDNTRTAYGVMALLVLALGVAGAVEQESAPVDIVAPVAKSATQEQIERILPERYAKPIAERTTYPRTMAAIAHTETVAVGGNHRTVGDGGKSKGLFQVQPRYWGGVDLDDLESQVDQADRVFVRLVDQYGYKEAVRRWNGDGPASRRYQRQVLAKVEGLR